MASEKDLKSGINQLAAHFTSSQKQEQKRKAALVMLEPVAKRLHISVGQLASEIKAGTRDIQGNVVKK